jgi:predicted amidohydrolase
VANWKVAGVQMDCRFGDKPHNLGVMRARLREAAAQGARLVVFPECILTGYGFQNLEEAQPLAETIPGPSSLTIAADCQSLNVWAVYGLLERDPTTGHLFNACALVGPDGVAGGYRKVHLPCLGVDRFVTGGDRPFAVHDLGGLRIGINICYDGSFPEAARVLALLGADLVVLPTNWPTNAAKTAEYLVPARALENHIYYLAVNRIGEEQGFRFIGGSRAAHFSGDLLACAGEGEEIIFAGIDPEQARQKRIVHIPGAYEVDRVGNRRPEMYGPLVAPVIEPTAPPKMIGASARRP